MRHKESEPGIHLIKLAMRCMAGSEPGIHMTKLAMRCMAGSEPGIHLTKLAMRCMAGSEPEIHLTKLAMGCMAGSEPGIHLNKLALICMAGSEPGIHLTKLAMRCMAGSEPGIHLTKLAMRCMAGSEPEIHLTKLAMGCMAGSEPGIHLNKLALICMAGSEPAIHLTKLAMRCMAEGEPAIHLTLALILVCWEACWYTCTRTGRCYLHFWHDSWLINSLWPSDAIWRYRSVSTLVQAMACCLTASSHYLNQRWLIIGEVLWHSPEGNFTWSAQDIYPQDIYVSLKITNLRLHPHPQGTDELRVRRHNIHVMVHMTDTKGGMNSFHNNELIISFCNETSWIPLPHLAFIW